MAKPIILFTNSFPYGNAEQFLEPEIVILAQKFDKIFIFPFEGQGIQRHLPSNCEVINVNIRVNPQIKIRYLVAKHFVNIITLLCFLIYKSRVKWFYLKSLKNHLTMLAVLMEESVLYEQVFEKYLHQTEVLYFYWFRRPFLQFALMKHRKSINHKLVSRGLGYDYDPAQHNHAIFQYREIEMRYINQLVTNSAWGAKLVQQLYPPFAKKVSFKYLGLDVGAVVNSKNGSGVFHLVSCSYVVESKRLNLIVEILKHVKIEMKWTHIGTGPMLPAIKELASQLPPNITVVFPGYIPSVKEFYEKESCDLFITTTLREGLPFSLMEAIAYGIPVMGPDLCGIPEVVTKATGFLLPSEINVIEAAKIIEKYAAESSEYQHELRKSAREFFDKTFTGKVNINQFINEYLK